MGDVRLSAEPLVSRSAARKRAGLVEEPAGFFVAKGVAPCGRGGQMGKAGWSAVFNFCG